MMPPRCMTWRKWTNIYGHQAKQVALAAAYSQFPLAKHKDRH